ncbi:MAG: hypothetical protein ABSD13_09475 [Candidatus Korobacteraceae bacterium]|jgi:hypothetical protein
MLSTVVSLITTLGVLLGAFLGAFFQSRFEQQKQVNEQEREMKLRRYKNILLLMLTKFEPTTGLPKLKLEHPDIKDIDDLDQEIRAELFYAMLFASDDVIAAMTKFVESAGYPAYIRTVTAMRRDLWNKKTSIDETALTGAMAIETKAGV